MTLHLKPYPFFVSDALTSDVSNTLARLAASSSTASLAADLSAHIAKGTLKLEAAGPLNLFLASPEPMWCANLAAPSLKRIRLTRQGTHSHFFLHDNRHAPMAHGRVTQAHGCRLASGIVRVNSHDRKG